MSMRCPVCRAADNQTTQCRRCKADLSFLVKLDRDRVAFLAAAQRHAGQGDAASCLAEARREHELRPDSGSYRVLALGFLLKREFGAAWLAYQKAHSHP